MKRRLPLFILLIVCHISIFPQDRMVKIADSVNTLIEISDKHNLNSNFQDALKYATLAVKHANTSSDQLLQGEATICLANTYQMVEDNVNAEKYFKSVLELGKQLDNYFLKAASLNGLGNVYSRDRATADVAADYYEESIGYAIDAGKQEHIFIGYLNICDMYLDHEASDRAFLYLQKAEQQLAQLEKQSPIYLALLNVDFAKYHRLQKQYSIAINYIDKAQKIGEDNKLYLDLIDIHGVKSEILQQIGNYDAAIASLKQQQYYNDLNYNSERAQQIQEIEAKFKVSEYEKEAKISKAETRNIVITAIGILLLTITLSVLYFLTKKRLDNEALQKHNQALQLAKNEAERVNKSKSELLINISHELRTPVYGIIGVTSMLMDEVKDNNQQKELLSALKFSGDNLKNLVNNILRHEEIETKKVAINTKPTNLHQLIIDSVSPFMAKVRENQNGLVLNIASAISKVYDIDDDKLTEILVNLISNANKFTNEGRVELKVVLDKRHEDMDTIVFTISDTGVGMPEEKLDTIFESFKQVQTNTVYGAGLGLSIAKHLIEAMGGTIKVKSELDKGSEFTFTLDFKVSDEIEDDLVMTKPDIDVLVVEDNKINQLVTQKLLSGIGYDCVIVENGLEAVELCKVRAFDLVLMDINMPVMNGIDATKAIKAFKPELTIIALTALEISEIEGECEAVGMDDVINKPINKDQLETVINKNLLAIV